MDHFVVHGFCSGKSEYLEMFLCTMNPLEITVKKTSLYVMLDFYRDTTVGKIFLIVQIIA